MINQYLYSLHGAYPDVLPESIRMPDGLTRTDSSTFTEEEILLAGYVKTHNPPDIDEKTQICSWDGSQWVVSSKTPEEIQEFIDNKWHAIRSNRNILLTQTDWMAIKSIETGIPLSESVKVYRQSLRDITLQLNPFNIQWPIFPSGRGGGNP